MRGWLPRLQLIELEDQPWFPAIIRDYATDYLRFIERLLQVHHRVAPILAPALLETNSEEILDLCSGGGGPVLEVRKALENHGWHGRVVLTDLYPNGAANARIRAEEGDRVRAGVLPVDARRVPPELGGFRTFFNAFHHFDPDEARGILRDAVVAGRPVGVFELPHRGLVPITVGLVTPVLVAASTPFIRPFRWTRLLWTYLIPAVPFTCMWDGVVSMLRAYTPDELLAIARSVDAPGYRWDAGVVDGDRPGERLTWLLGIPDGSSKRTSG